jgi:hypothetical protein
MGAIGLHQARIADHIHQDERHEWNLVTCRQIDIDLVERPGTPSRGWAALRRTTAPRCRASARPRRCGSCWQRAGDRDSAQAVIRAERPRHRTSPSSARSRRARVRRRLSRDARVDHLIWKPARRTR